MQVRRQGAAAAAFGHAVELDQPARPARQHVGLQRRGEGRAGAELHAERRQVEAAELGQRHQPLVLHRHEHGVGDAVPLGQAQVLEGVELGHQHRGAAPGQRRQEDHQRGVRVERRGEQRGRVRAVAVGGAAAAHLRPAHRVRLDDALGRAGGARGIDDVERPVGLRARPARARRLRAPARPRRRGLLPSRRGRRAARRAASTAAKLAAVPASTNSSFAPESASMPARLFAVSPGASGATTTPARRAPRKTAAYSTEALAQTAIASCGRTPSRCSAAAMRSISASSPP